MKKNVKLKSIFFIFTLFCLSAIVYQFPISIDMTANKINSLSESNRTLLSAVDQPLIVELYSTNKNIIEQTKTILSLFQKESTYVTLNLHDKLLDPVDKAQLRLQTHNNLLLMYKDRKKAIDINAEEWNAQIFSNLIQHMVRGIDDWVVFLSGHGECEPFGKENRDLSQLTTALKTTGINVASLNLGEISRIPDNTKMLVIADPKIAFLPEETHHILNYVREGGNLLWLLNPNTTPHLDELAQELGIRWQSGTLLDQKSHAMGTPHPAISILRTYPNHAITQPLKMLTVFPWARALQVEEPSKLGWQRLPLLITHESATQENKTIKGPFTIGIALEKNNQRIVAIGNTTFLSNASIHNYGNLALAHNLFNWLITTDFLLNTSIKPAQPLVDLSFTESIFTKTTLQFIFPFCLPFLYLLIGWQTQRLRHRRCQLTGLLS